MSLALLTFGVLCTRPAQAQTPGHWEFDHLGCSGGGSGTGGRIVGPTWSYPWASTVTINPVSDSYGDADTSTISVTITPFFRWMPGSDPSAPPSVLRAKITSAAYAGDANDESSPSLSADNGFGDKSNQVPPGYQQIGVSSVGTHLEHKDPQGQTLVSLPPQTLLAVGGFSYDWRDISTEVDYQVEADNRNRAVTITSSIDPTYHKDPVLGKVANAPASDGTVTADSVNLWPSSLPRILYNAVPTGSWDPNSSYHWYSAAMGNSDAGTFAPPTFPEVYPPIGTSNQEHVNLHCIDASDGASATANYYVNWHDPVEGWYKDPSKTIDHPLPLVSNGVVNASGDWMFMFFIDNNTPSPSTQNLKQDITIKKTMQGTIGGQVSGPIEAAAFQANESITVGQETSKTFSVDTTFTGHAFTRTEFYEGQSWEERAGTCSLYGTNGYQNDAAWNGIYVSDPAVGSPGANVVIYYPGYKP